MRVWALCRREGLRRIAPHRVRRDLLERRVSVWGAARARAQIDCARPRTPRARPRHDLPGPMFAKAGRAKLGRICGPSRFQSSPSLVEVRRSLPDVGHGWPNPSETWPKWRRLRSDSVQFGRTRAPKSVELGGHRLGRHRAECRPLRGNSGPCGTLRPDFGQIWRTCQEVGATAGGIVGRSGYWGLRMLWLPSLDPLGPTPRRIGKLGSRGKPPSAALPLRTHARWRRFRLPRVQPLPALFPPFALRSRSCRCFLSPKAHMQVGFLASRLRPWPWRVGIKPKHEIGLG